MTNLFKDDKNKNDNESVNNGYNLTNEEIAEDCQGILDMLNGDD